MVPDIVGLYVDPPDHAVVPCVDEKSQIQALARTARLLPMQPGQAERRAERTHDYRPHGTTSLFTALDVNTGTAIGQTHPGHRAAEFRKFLSSQRNPASGPCQHESAYSPLPAGRRVVPTRRLSPATPAGVDVNNHAGAPLAGVLAALTLDTAPSLPYACKCGLTLPKQKTRPRCGRRTLGSGPRASGRRTIPRIAHPIATTGSPRHGGDLHADVALLLSQTPVSD